MDKDSDIKRIMYLCKKAIYKLFVAANNIEDRNVKAKHADIGMDLMLELNKYLEKYEPKIVFNDEIMQAAHECIPHTHENELTGIATNYGHLEPEIAIYLCQLNISNNDPNLLSLINTVIPVDFVGPEPCSAHVIKMYRELADSNQPFFPKK